MRKVIQKRIVKVIQPEKVEYYCDACGTRCGISSNPKEEWSTPCGMKHYCKRGCKND
jgi:uncharacterized UBP type Zn finger protein